MIYLQLLGGFVLLLGGAEFLVRGAVQLAARLGISPLIVGLTVVAYCTTMPELFVRVSSRRLDILPSSGGIGPLRAL